MSWLSRLRNAVDSSTLDRELDEEMRDHLERRIASYVDSGLTHAEAERKARLRFGNQTLKQEESREARLSALLESALQDIRYALRLMRKQPGLTAAIVLSLGLAIGANTAVFSIVEAAFLKPLPVHDPRQLIALAAPEADQDPVQGSPFSYPMLQQFRAAAGKSAQLSLFSFAGPLEIQMASDSSIEPVTGQLVSGDAFGMLGVAPAMGRLISPEDDRGPGQHPVVVLGYDFWRSRFQADPGAIGKTIIVKGVRSQIIGVAPRGFFGVEPGKIVELWQPSMQLGENDAFKEAGWAWFQIVGRAANGVSLTELETRLTRVLQDRRREVAKQRKTMPESLRRQYETSKMVVNAAPSGLSRFREKYRTPIWILLGIALSLLLIACANVASLLLARAAARASEVAMRVSLGAGRVRMLRQLLTESLMLAILGGGLGWLIAEAVVPAAMTGLSTTTESVNFVLPMNGMVLAFCLGVSLFASLMFGLAPAWQASRSEPLQALRGSSGQAGKLRLGRFFVSVQVAFAFALVMIGAALLFSLRNLTKVDTGFDAHGLTALGLQIDGAKLSRDQERQLMDQIVERVQQLPGVTAAAASGWPLFVGASWTEHVLVDGQAPGGPKAEIFYPVSRTYFATMKTPFLAGRNFEAPDFLKESDVPVVINQAFAKQYFPGRDPLGLRFQYGSSKLKTTVVIGVVRNTNYGDLRKGEEPIAYFPYSGGTDLCLYLRTANGSPPMAAINREVRLAQPGGRVGMVLPLERLIGDSILKERLLGVTSGTLAFLGLVLAAIGLFGLLNYSVTRRTREIGIRAALGARKSQIVGLVLRETVASVSVGLLAGFLTSALALRSLEQLLYRVGAADPAVGLMACAVFVSAALMSAGLPARKAAAVDPMSALRVE